MRKAWWVIVMVLSIGGTGLIFWWVRRQSIPPDPRVLVRQLYEENCAVCHGTQGDGQGQAAYLLQPKPRDFTLGKYRLVSTDNGQPTRDDLFRTLSNGLPGTAMPPWAHLSNDQRLALADYVLDFGRQSWIERAMQQGDSRPEAEAFAGDMIQPGNPIPIPPEPPRTDSSIQSGKQIFRDVCAKCHGEQGEGMWDPSWRTAEGFPVWSRAFQAGVFKGGSEGAQLFLRMAAGLPGSPMPASEETGEQIWQTVHYIQSLYDPEAQTRATVSAHELVAQRSPELPPDPDASEWSSVPEQWIALMPLWFSEEAVEGVRVKAVHDGSRVTFRLEWRDASLDEQVVQQTAFPDGAAIQFSADASPPLFAMGAAGRTVKIWHWKAVWEKDRDGYQEVSSAFPAMASDAYLGEESGWNSQPYDDPTYLPAMKLDNPVARRERHGQIEDANVAGFGTLTSRAPEEGSVQGLGRWDGGVWRLQVTRDLEGVGAQDVSFEPGKAISVAFAVWNGSAGDRNGQKAVSIWNTLRLEP